LSDPVPQTWLIPGFLGLLTSIFVYFRRKIDRTDERLQLIERTAVTHAELAEIMKLSEARAALADQRIELRHKENSDNFREMRLQLESVNSKLFELATQK
jgi:hypothetical protein